jgi:hypothetical protein
MAHSTGFGGIWMPPGRLARVFHMHSVPTSTDPCTDATTYTLLLEM